MNPDLAAKLWIVSRTDNVGTVVGDEAPGCATLRIIGALSGTIQTRTPVPHGHKVALEDLPDGAHVIKYGVVIGRLMQAVRRGEYVHTHNLESLRGRGDR
jgi:altronate dehydratase small subunit